MIDNSVLLSAEEVVVVSMVRLLYRLVRLALLLFGPLGLRGSFGEESKLIDCAVLTSWKLVGDVCKVQRVNQVMINKIDSSESERRHSPRFRTT